jgi:hypothetical protein
MPDRGDCLSLKKLTDTPIYALTLCEPGEEAENAVAA